MNKVMFTTNIISKLLKINHETIKFSNKFLHIRFQFLFSKKNETIESPRMREFRKKLRERTPIEKLEELEEGKHPYQEKEPLKPFPNNTNPKTGEIGGPRGPEPTRYGDWERKGFLLRVKEPDAKLEKKESIRMKQFHKKLKLQPIPRIPPKERFVDLVLVETDPNNGELITNNEKDPTKWGDWQNGGRVSDF